MPCSLGITLLEMASDLELPKGGETWHQLRNRQLPDTFTQGRETADEKHRYPVGTVHVSTAVNKAKWKLVDASLTLWLLSANCRVAACLVFGNLIKHNCPLYLIYYPIT